MAAAVIMMPYLTAPVAAHGTGGDLTPPRAGVVRHRRQATTQPTTPSPTTQPPSTTAQPTAAPSPPTTVPGPAGSPAVLADRDTLLALAQHWDSAGGRGFGQSRCQGWNATSAAELCNQTRSGGGGGCIGCNEDNTTIVGLCKKACSCPRIQLGTRRSGCRPTSSSSSTAVAAAPEVFRPKDARLDWCQSTPKESLRPPPWASSRP